MSGNVVLIIQLLFKQIPITNVSSRLSAYGLEIWICTILVTLLNIKENFKFLEQLFCYLKSCYSLHICTIHVTSYNLHAISFTVNNVIFLPQIVLQLKEMLYFDDQELPKQTGYKFVQ